MSGPNDFTTSLADVIASMEDRVRNGVEQPAELSVIFSSNVRSYSLPSNAIAITQVTGMVLNQFTLFEQGTDFIFSGGSLVWQGTGVPDEGTRLDIEYTYRELPSGLTDFNPGSVAGTILRAVAREMTLLYAQMDQAYRRAFIDEATGVALDNVVALLGRPSKRIEAQTAKGKATFLRKKPATQTVVIPAGTRIADQSGRIFTTKDQGSIPVQAEELQIPASGKVTTTNKIAEVIGVYRKSDNSVTPAAIPVSADFGPDERTIKFTGTPPNETVRIDYKPKSATVAIEAVDPGPNGNVNANSITLMPTPPPGIDGVSNEDPTQGGQDQETDERLRDRAKHALEQAGNATVNSIKYSVMAVEGVEGVEVIDNSTDNSLPLGEVRVRYSGGDIDEVTSAVEKTRAAGVVARIAEIVQVFITGTFYLIPSQQPSPDAGRNFVDAVGGFINGLTIGTPLPIRRLNSFAFGISGLADVAEAQLQSHKPKPSDPGIDVTSDPLLILGSELVRTGPGALQVDFLQALKVTANNKTAPGTYTIDLQLIDSQGQPINFKSFSVDIQALARATLKANPSQAPTRVGLFTKTVQFSNSATTQLTINVATDLKDFNPATHNPVVEFQLTAAAYSVLQSATRSFDVTA